MSGQPLIRKGIVALIAEADGYALCGEASTAAETRQLCQEHQPDLVVMDLALEKGDGLSLLRELRRLREGVRLVVVGAEDDRRTSERIFRAGAHGYIVREDGLELPNAFAAVFQNELFASHHARQALYAGILQREPRLREGDATRLSDRELAVFERIGRGLGPTRIGSELGMTVKTVEAHQARMKEKLGIGNAVELRRRAEEWVNRGPDSRSRKATSA